MIEVTYARDWKQFRAPPTPAVEIAATDHTRTSVKARAVDTKGRHRGIIELNRGTIVNTTPTHGRNQLVSIDGAPPEKLKRTVVGRQARPYRIIPNRELTYVEAS